MPKYAASGQLGQFSVTSGTIFASRKMDFVDLLAAICLIVNASKGISMVQLSRDFDCQYKTAFVLAHKLREAMAMEVHTGEVLDGHVEIDGAYFGGHIRPANQKSKRVDRVRLEAIFGFSVYGHQGSFAVSRARPVSYTHLTLPTIYSV